MSYRNFKIAFWHPMGPHSGEREEKIIARKREEIEANGWTLWSFQHRQMLKDWYRELEDAEPEKVLVFCSHAHGAVDPARREGTSNIDCKSYRFVSDKETECRPIPRGVRVPHPFRPGKKLPSAFVVQRVKYPVDINDLPAVEWFSLQEGPWRSEKVPSRGEYLIRRGGTHPMRSVSVVLELKRPYLAVITVD